MDPMHTAAGVVVVAAEPVPPVELRLEALTLGLNLLAAAVLANTTLASEARADATEAAIATADRAVAAATAVLDKLQTLESTTMDKLQTLESTTMDRLQTLESTTMDRLQTLEATTMDKLQTLEAPTRHRDAESTAAAAATAATAVLDKLQTLDATMRHRDAESAKSSVALAAAIDRVLADQRGAQRDAALAQAHAAHNETLQLERKGLSAEVKESAAALEASRVRLEEREFKFETERTGTAVSMDKLAVALEQERAEHNKLKVNYAVPVNKGRSFEASSLEWLCEHGLEVEDVHRTPHTGDALVTIPGFGLPVLIDFKNVNDRKASSKEMGKLIADARRYGQRTPPVVLGGVIVVYPDTMSGGATNCESALTGGQTTEGSVGVIRADRKWFCPRRLLLSTLFKLVASYGDGGGGDGGGGGGSGTVHKFCYEDEICVKMITHAHQVAQMPWAPIVTALDAVKDLGHEFKTLLKLRAELAVSMPLFTAANPVTKALQVALPAKLRNCWSQPVAPTELLASPASLGSFVDPCAGVGSPLHSSVKLAASPNPPPRSLAAEPLDSATRKRNRRE